MTNTKPVGGSTSTVKSGITLAAGSACPTAGAKARSVAAAVESSRPVNGLSSNSGWF